MRPYDFGCHFPSDQSTCVTDQFEIPVGSSIWNSEKRKKTVRLEMIKTWKQAGEENYSHGKRLVDSAHQNSSSDYPPCLAVALETDVSWLMKSTKFTARQTNKRGKKKREQEIGYKHVLLCL